MDGTPLFRDSLFLRHTYETPVQARARSPRPSGYRRHTFRSTSTTYSTTTTYVLLLLSTTTTYVLLLLSITTSSTSFSSYPPRSCWASASAP